MSKINSHPILDVPKRDKVVFTFNGKKIEGEKGFTIAAALHQAGYPVHSHSLDGRGTVPSPVASGNVGLVRCWWMVKSGVFA